VTFRHFSKSHPAGIAGVEMTSLEIESGQSLEVMNVAKHVAAIFAATPGLRQRGAVWFSRFQFG
jgi:lipoate-protein ligase B